LSKPETRQSIFHLYSFLYPSTLCSLLPLPLSCLALPRSTGDHRTSLPPSPPPSLPPALSPSLPPFLPPSHPLQGAVAYPPPPVWSPTLHATFPLSFQWATHTLLLMGMRRKEMGGGGRERGRMASPSGCVDGELGGSRRRDEWEEAREEGKGRGKGPGRQRRARVKAGGKYIGRESNSDNTIPNLHRSRLHSYGVICMGKGAARCEPSYRSLSLPFPRG
jgi:hypothetical protein